MSYFVGVVAPERRPVAGTYIIGEVQSYSPLFKLPTTEAKKEKGIAATEAIRECEKTHCIKDPLSLAVHEMMKHFPSS